MKFSKICFVLLLLFVLFSNIYAQNLKIGFVDLKKVFRDLKQVKQMENKIRRETEVELAKIKGLREEAKELKTEIPLYKAGSRIRQRKEKKLTEKLFQVKWKKERANHFFTQKLKIGLEQIYQHICQEIKIYARKNNFFMVLRISEPDFFGSKTAEALKMKIHTRDILFWKEKFDITNKIIELMNKKYNSKNKNFSRN